MRVAIVGNAAFTLTNFRGPLITDIVQREHSVFALAPDYSTESRAAIIQLGAQPVDYQLVATGLNPFLDWRSARELKSILASLSLDVVLSFGIKPAIYGTLAARQAGVPSRYVLVTGLGYAFTEGREITVKRRVVGIVARLLYRHALRHTRRVFMQNPDDAADFVRMNIVTPDKVVAVNGTGVELDKWHQEEAVMAPVTFLLAARMLRDKGIMEFVTAARFLKARYPRARFILAGATDSNPEAISVEQIAAWVDEGIVEWPGHINIRAWLAQTSVFVLPSYREGVPRSTQEAMAMGRPIITTDAPGCRETVVHGKNGFMVPPHNAGALASAMERFLVEPDLIAQMGEESRAVAEERFDVRRINATMIDAMEL